MRLFLTSSGIDTDYLKNVFKDTFFKNQNLSEKKVSVIPNAETMDIERIGNFNKKFSELKSIGFHPGNIDYIDIEEEKFNANILLEYDVIYFLGGDPPRLLKAIKDKNIEITLAKFVELDKVIIGWSAGTMVCCKTFEWIYYKMDDKKRRLNETFNYAYRYPPPVYEKNDALNFFNEIIYPHFDTDRHGRNGSGGFDESAIQFEKDSNVKMIRINDGEAISINGNSKEYKIILKPIQNQII